MEEVKPECLLPYPGIGEVERQMRGFAGANGMRRNLETGKNGSEEE